jgi:hypothetical protein
VGRIKAGRVEIEELVVKKLRVVELEVEGDSPAA